MMPEKEDWQFSQSRDGDCDAHCRLIRTKFRHIGKQIGGRRHRSQATKKGSKKKKNPLAVCEKDPNVAVVRSIFIRLPKCKFSADKKIDKHDGCKSPEPNFQTICVDHPSSDGRE